MFKWKSTDRPSTPKLGSVALPDYFSPTRAPTPLKSSVSEKPSKGSFFNRFRSATPLPEKTHRVSLSDVGHSRGRAFAVSQDDDDEVIFKPGKLTRSSSILAKTKVTLVPSKASKEEEMERREEQIEELKRLAQMKQPASRAGPRKSCLKGGSSPPSIHPFPSPLTPHEFPSSYPDRRTKRYDSSPNYHSDTEQYRPAQRSSRHSHHPRPAPQISLYHPSDPAHPTHRQGPTDYQMRQDTVDQRHRPRNLSLTDRQQPIHLPQVTPGHTPKYMKAYIKEVPLKDEAIALSWPLVDYDARQHAKYPPVFFDAAFDPRVRGFEIRVLRFGERSMSLMTRDEETLPVSPHAFMTEITLINERLPQWPVVIKNTRGIRCIDVFRAIHDTYAIVLTKAEIIHCGRDYIERCQRAFNQRCEDGPQLPPVTKAKGLCRVDLLRGEHVFKGLTPMSGPGLPPNCWKLHFEKITSSRTP